MRKAFLLVLCLGFALGTILMAPQAVRAQASTAKVEGDVLDPIGLAVSGAKVTLTSAESGVVRNAQTDSSGHYSFPALAPGLYTLTVEKAGFRKWVNGTKLQLLVNTVTRVDAKLELGSVTETVVVSEAGAVLNTADASLGNVITPQQVHSLPLEARSPVALLTLQPGVVFSGDPADSRSGAVNGGRSDQANVTLDGVDVNDQQTQAALSTALQVPLVSIEEFRFTTSNPNADQGRSSGGQVAFVTKKGTNDFHGTAFWTHRNTATTANDFFNGRAGIKVPKLLRNQYGGDFGGRVIRNRLFVYGAYEGNRRREETNATRIVPTDSLRDGALIYQCATGSTCPGGTVVGKTKSFTVPAGFFGLTPADVKTIDPLNASNPPAAGENAAMLALFSQYPGCNDNSLGLDAGINFCGFRFNAPVALNNDVFVARVDFNLSRDSKHQVSWRGTLGNLKRDSVEAQFPGQAPAQKFLDNSKGYVVSYSGQLRSSLTSVTRYGYTRQGNEFSGEQAARFNTRSFDDLSPTRRALIRLIPTHNVTEDATWTHGTHTLQFGTNFRFIRNNRASFANAFPSFSINDGFCARLCNDVRDSMGPGKTFPQFPAVGNSNPFKRALMGLYGTITTIGSAAFFDGSQNNLAAGQGTGRKFVYNEYEFYGQDSWRMFRSFTLTLGVRYGYYGVPYEANGLQVTTVQNIMSWFESRRQAALAGLPSGNIPLLSWDIAGQANNRPGYYRPDKNNFAPNVSFAYSPQFKSGWLEKLFGGPGKSVIRGGGRVLYDRVGGSFVVSQDLNGAVGLVSPLSNATGLLNFAGPTCTVPPTAECAAPRFTGLSSLTFESKFLNVPTAGFPTTPPATFSSEGFAVDNGLRTPYSYAFDLSYGRELPFKMALEVDYVGRLGHSLLAKADLAAPLIYLVDPKSGKNYAQAINQLYLASGKGATPNTAAGLATIAPIPYFENIFKNIATLVGTCSALPGCTATQRVYVRARGAFPSFTDSLNALEGLTAITAVNGRSSPQGFAFFQPQFDALPTWTNFGRANYHALQATLRRRFSQGLLFQFNYTYSKSIDNASAVENSTQFGGQIADAFFPNNFRAVSAFDLRHQVTANWVYELPFGRGKMLGGDVSGWLNQIIGGWQTSGILRWRGAFPIQLENGFNFPTNFFLTGPGTQICPISTGVVKNAPGGPNLFGGDTASIQKAFDCLDFTLSGSSGSRNSIRGANFFNLDFGLQKEFSLPLEGHKFVFSWQVFNLPNHPNFDDRTLRTNPEAAVSEFGKYVSTIGADERSNNGRVMQFSFSYRF